MEQRSLVPAPSFSVKLELANVHPNELTFSFPLPVQFHESSEFSPLLCSQTTRSNADASVFFDCPAGGDGVL